MTLNRLVLVGYDLEASVQLKRYFRETLPNWVISVENEVQDYLNVVVNKYDVNGLNLLYQLEEVFTQQIVLIGLTDWYDKKNQVTTGQKGYLNNIIRDILTEQNTKTKVFVWQNSPSCRMKEMAKHILSEVFKEYPITLMANKIIETEFDVCQVINP